MVGLLGKRRDVLDSLSCDFQLNPDVVVIASCFLN